MNNTAEQTRKVGDVVGVTGRAGRWEIVKVNKTTVELKPLDGQSNRNLRTYPYMLGDAPEPAVPGQIGRPYVEVTFFEPGQVVTCSIPKLAGRLLVVTNDRGKDKVSCSPLFASHFEGWGIPRPTLTVVEPADVLRVLLLRVYEHAPLDDDEKTAIGKVRGLLDDDSIARALKQTANGS